MVKYIEYDKVETQYTTLEFRGGDSDVKVNYFTGDDVLANVVSILGDEDKINALIEAQNKEINCREITKDEFKTLVQNSIQVKRVYERINEFYTKEMKSILEKYPLAERETWNIQLSEAKAYLQSKDESDAPFLKTLATAEGSTVEDFANAVVAKAEDYRALSAAALAKKRAFERELLGELGL